MHSAKTSISLNVSNAPQSAAFYEALLGAPPKRRSPGTIVFEFETPSLVLTLETRSAVASAEPGHTISHTSRGIPSTRRSSPAQNRFALVVTEPEHVGQAAIALRRAGVRLRLQDQGLEAHDPDGNEWRVRFAPFTRVRAVEVSVESSDERD